jgi:hypothetical protein
LLVVGISSSKEGISTGITELLVVNEWSEMMNFLGVKLDNNLEPFMEERYHPDDPL